MINTLTSAINQIALQRSILFLGAGFSSLATNINDRSMLLASGLSKRLAIELEENAEADLETMSGLYIDTFGRKKLLTVLEEEFRCAYVSDVQQKILSMPWKRIYTTNYDNVIEKCLEVLKVDYQVYTRTDRVPGAFENKLACVHLNGYINKVNEDNFDDEILLTDFQYLTNNLTQTPWSTKLRTDFHVARNVFFVGYSMSDIDISKILFESGIVGQKLFFIQAEELDSLHKRKLSRFGDVHSIGLASFAHKLGNMTPLKEEELRKGFLVNFREVKLETSEPKRPTAADAFALLFRGDIRRPCMNWDLANCSEDYRIRREQMEEIIQLVDSSACTIFLHSDIGNGKKLFAEEVVETFVSKGRRCFRFEALSDDLSDDITFLENVEQNEKIIIYIPDYYSYEHIVDSLRVSLPNVVILTTSSSAARDLRSSLPGVAGESYSEYSLNRLSDRDIRKLDELIASYGYWGKLAGYSPWNRQKFIRDNCGRSLRSLVLTLFNQENIKRQIEAVFKKAKQDSSESFSCFVKLLALGASGHEPSFKEVCEILGVPFANRIIKRDGGWVSEFFERKNGQQIVKSSIFAQYLLRHLVSDRIIMDELIALIEDLDRKAKGNVLFRKLRTFPLRFSFVERLFEDDGKRTKLVEYYEAVRQKGIGKNNPQFWLQYAIARMSFKDYENAGSYFQTAFSLSGKMQNYDDFQIKNHYARFLLESCIGNISDRDAVDVFLESHEILVGQIGQKSQGHYPYRVAQKYLDFIKAKHKNFDSEGIDKFKSACDLMLSFIGDLSPGMRKNRHVKRCKDNIIASLNFVDELH